jgi:hypothetical protein
MFFTAPETKNFTLEEMDDVFDSGVPAWRKLEKGSRLDELQQEIAHGKHAITETATAVEVEKTV